MKSSNKQYIDSLEQELGKLQTVLKTSKKSETPELLAKEVQDKALGILVDIAGYIEQRYPHLAGKEREDYAVRVLERLVKQQSKNKSTDSADNTDSANHNKHTTETIHIPTIEELLDTVSTTITKILDTNASFVPDIYRKNDGQTVQAGDGETTFDNTLRTAPKFEGIMKVLQETYSIANIVVSTERIDQNRMRRMPYKIIHILDKTHPITITVSDEIGEATYVFGGYVSFMDLIDAKK